MLLFKSKLKQNTSKIHPQTFGNKALLLNTILNAAVSI